MKAEIKACFVLRKSYFDENRETAKNLQDAPMDAVGQRLVRRGASARPHSARLERFRSATSLSRSAARAPHIRPAAIRAPLPPGSEPRLQPATYLQWNDGLAASFFHPGMAGRPVSLFVTEETITSLAEGDPAASATFVAAVKQGPPWADGTYLCARAVSAFRNWRERGLEFPPYIAYLGLFVLAAGLEADVAPNNYYRRLWQLLGTSDGQHAPPGFEKMQDLWLDLERWSEQDAKGGLGIFRARSVGKHQHVGIPKAQTLLNQEERRALPAIFADAGLDPLAMPAEESFARAVLKAGQGTLRAPTLALLRAEGDLDRRAALISALAEDLTDWDGRVDPAPEQPQTSARYGQLRICLDLDRVARRARPYFRCSLPGASEGAAVVLQRPGGGYLVCEMLPGGVSTAVTDSERAPFPAAAMNWAAGGALRSEGGWTVRLPAGDVRLLGDGSAAGTRGWIEIRQLPRASPVLLLAAPSAAAHIARWLGTAAEAGEELTGIEGIPQGWRLFAAPRIRSDKDVRDAYPVLTFPLLTKIRLIGGIHADSSTEYFAFAPPRIRLEGELGDETVLTDGEPIAAGGPEQLSHFPASTPGPHTVELSRAGEVIAPCLASRLSANFAAVAPSAVCASVEVK